jgi:hypothetical protein
MFHWKQAVSEILVQVLEYLVTSCNLCQGLHRQIRSPLDSLMAMLKEKQKAVQL